MKDLAPDIPEVEYDFFREHILPPLHDSIDINGIIAHLKRDEIIVDGAGNNSLEILGHTPRALQISTAQRMRHSLVWKGSCKI